MCQGGYDIILSYTHKALNDGMFLEVKCPNCARGDDIITLTGDIVQRRSPPFDVLFSVNNYSPNALMVRFVLDMFLPWKGRVARIETNWFQSKPRRLENTLYISDGSGVVNSSFLQFPDGKCEIFGWDDVKESDHLTMSWYIQIIQGPAVLALGPHTNLGYKKVLDPCCARNGFTDCLVSALKDGILWDFSFLASGQRIWCHKFVLRSRSPFFRAMFTPSFTEFHDNSFVLEDTSPKSIESLLLLVYGQRISGAFTLTELVEILALSHRFMFRICYEDVKRKIMCKKTVDFANAVLICEVAHACNLPDLEAWASLKVLRTCSESIPTSTSYSGMWLKTLIAGLVKKVNF